MTIEYHKPTTCENCPHRQPEAICMDECRLFHYLEWGFDCLSIFNNFITMKAKGFIKSVVPSLNNGAQRTWISPQGEKFEFYDGVVVIPHTTQNGSTYEDTILVTIVRKDEGNPVLPYADYIGKEELLDLTLLFSVKTTTAKDRMFMSCKLSNVSKVIEQ